MADNATSSLPRARIEHRIGGRVRLRIEGKRGDVSFFQHAEAVLGAQPDISGVTTNPRTGSILVEHRGSAASILAAAREKALFEAAAPPSPAVARRPGQTRSSPLNLAAAGLAAAGVVQLARGQVVGSASENLWNAYGLYAANKGSWAPALLVGFGIMQIFRGQALGSATSLFLYAFSARTLAQRRNATGQA